MKLNNINKVAIISVLTYALFFNKFLLPSYSINRGDATSFHYPGAHYLREKILDGEFPFWTERIFGGTPIYASAQFGYLNPVHILAVLLFGPISSFKLIHFLTYFGGSIGLYLYMKDKGLSKTTWFIANLTYYFSSFGIFKQELYVLIYVFHLFPLNLYLLHKHLLSKQAKYLWFNALVIAFTFYYGNFNSIFFNLIPLFLYTLVYASNKIKSTFIYFGKLALFLTIITGPVLVPSLFLYTQSYRGGAAFDFTEGTLAPVVASTLAYPFILGTPDSYMGQVLDNYYLQHEITLYAGLVILLASILGFLLSNDTKLKAWFILIASTFLMLAFLEKSPLLPLLDIPPINKFRYWSRMYFFVLFGIAYFAGVFVDKYLKSPKFKINIVSNIKYVFFPVTFFVVLVYLNKNTYNTLTFLDHLKTLSYYHDWYFKKWLVINLLTVLLLVTGYFLKKQKLLVSLSLALVTIDLFVVTQATNNYLYKKGTELIDSNLAEVSSNFINLRVLHEQSKISGNKFLYYPTWGLFGYDQLLESDEYKKYLSSELNSDISNFSDPEFDVTTWDPELIQNIKDLGIRYVINEDNTGYTALSSSNSEFFMTPVHANKVSVTKRAEGDVKLNLYTDGETLLKSNIKYMPGWLVKVNGEKINLSKDGNFITVPVKSGTNIIEFRYFPIHILYGVVLSIFMTVVYGLINRNEKV